MFHMRFRWDCCQLHLITMILFNFFAHSITADQPPPSIMSSLLDSDAITLGESLVHTHTQTDNTKTHNLIRVFHLCSLTLCLMFAIMFPFCSSAGLNPPRIQSMLQSLPAPPPPPGMQINPAAAQPALPPPPSAGAAGQAKKTCPFCLQQLSWHALSRHIRDMHKGGRGIHVFLSFCTG